jgi:hypothetical protein
LGVRNLRVSAGRVIRCQAEAGAAPDGRQHLARAAAERNEVNVLLIEAVEVGIGGQSGVEHQFLGQAAGLLVPEIDEALDLRELTKQKVPHEFIRVAKGRHGLAGADKQEITAANTRALEFIERHMQK